jgi:hypothetical protein
MVVNRQKQCMVRTSTDWVSLRVMMRSWWKPSTCKHRLMMSTNGRVLVSVRTHHRDLIVSDHVAVCLSACY